jgi:predicted nucleic-acid-binding protein
VKAIDTNLLVRYLVRDDEAQAAIADRIIQDRCYLSLTVLLESVWLLSSRFALSRDAISRALEEFLSLPPVTTVDDELVLWAIMRFQSGADFADMVHLLDGRSADAFTTFDRGVAKGAGKNPPLPIETLKA